MIRRQVGQEYWLITQDDHAILSGKMARHFGNDEYDPLSGPGALLGIAKHDSGWPLHDDHPQLNAKRLPLDVFESPRQVTLPVWEKSVETAIEADRYAGLLVSVHVFRLSIYASEQKGSAAGSWNLNEPRTRFEINRFQHRIIEIQENLRKILGMRTDLPLTQGLSSWHSIPAEARLVADFYRLQAMDMASLAICCTQLPFETHSDLSLHFQREGNDLIVKPWPFSAREIKMEVPYRRVPAREYADQADLQATLDAASIETFTVSVRPNRI